MLDLINRYCHGFVALPVINSIRQEGIFELFKNSESVEFETVLKHYPANKAYMKVAFRLLESLEILQFNGAYQTGKRFNWLDEIPADINTLLQLDILTGSISPKANQLIDNWLALALKQGSVNDSMLADYLDGLILIPLLLHNRISNEVEESFADRFDFLLDSGRLEALFLAKGWVVKQPEKTVFTCAGEHFLDRIFIAGTVYSYQPMLRGMSELLFGDASKVFQRDDEGHELHLDRLMNVQGSGFQHGRYFNDCQEIIADIFNQLPVENQPDYIADMGCGDGSLLKRIYQLILTETRRGEVLAEYPLLLIGADYNQQALLATVETLAGLPYKTIQADIGNPEQFLKDLLAAGVSSPDKVLHIRSFLDHDRPYIAPKNKAQLEQRPEGRSHGVYVDNNGQLIASKTAYQSLVEHLARWSAILGQSGALFLEVHSMAPCSVAQYIDQSENLHFDAYHGFSGQMLADADEFLLAAAESGLFPKLDFSRNYPKTLPFCRLTLNWFEKRQYSFRVAFARDLPALEVLDKACWAENLSAGIDIIKARLVLYPQGQFVIEQRGKIVGAFYSQRIQNDAALDNTDFYQMPSLHDPQGSIVQILGMNIAPEFQHLGLGDQVLDFILYVYSLDGQTDTVLGISRCKEFVDQPDMAMEKYLQQCRDNGQWDTILNFHVQHGAEIVKPIKDYWLADVDNQGYGVLIRYTLSDNVKKLSDAEQVELSNDPEVRNKLIDKAILTILGKRRKHLFAADRALMESGLDSLDLLELRSLLSRYLGVKLEPMFFFSYGTANEIKAYFDGAEKPKETTVEQSIVPDFSRLQAVNTTPQSGQFDVAIVGMSCRFPGSVNSPESFWQLLQSGQDAIEKVPLERWDNSLYAEEDVSPYGGFIKDVDQFDAGFFQLSPREARLIDPQHRLLLETAWKAFENAGINPDLAKKTGVFVGIYAHDYELLAAQRNQDKHFDVYHAIGNSASMAAGRLSYFFGFQGPAISVDTACSSSLVAVQQACDSLRKGESKVALAGGVNLMLAPDLTIAFSKSGMLAEDGHCKTFAADADGYVRSEGCGLVVLKPLEQALNDNDCILAVIKGSSVNQDGASNGITAPNGLAQQELMQQALQHANVKANEISLLEAHGTGTPLGDPVEMDAIAHVYSQDRDSNKPLLISSVKTNIGHAESAAGIAGLIKLVLAFKHQYVPAHLHLKQLNPRLSLAALPARIPTHGATWSAVEGKPRLAAISAFGFSGTNAHMILAEAPQQDIKTIDIPCVLPVSAPTPEALVALAKRYQQQLGKGEQPALLNIAATAAMGRKHFSQRLAFCAVNTEGLLVQLTDYIQLESIPEFVPTQNNQLVFLFTGQGAQYLNMAKQLYRTRSYFRELFDQCSELFAVYINLSLTELLFSGEYKEQDIQQTGVTQPALFCLEYALAKQWQQWGIKPDILIGHSIGEYAVACLANVFSLEDGIKLVAKRGQLMQAQLANGKMVAVNCTRQQLETLLPKADDRVIACFNSEDRLVISGAESAINSAIKILINADISVAELNVSHAFHSPLMNGMLAEFKQVLAQIEFKKPSLRIISTLTGQEVTEQMSAVDYWANQIVQPVDFTTAINTLSKHKADKLILMEIGPKSVLTGLAKQILSTVESIQLLPALDPYINDNLRIADNMALLYQAGLTVNWQAFYGHLPFNKVALPHYPFQRQRYWLDDVYPDKRHQYTINNAHPLLGSAISAPQAVQYQSHINQNQPEWLAGHVVNNEVIFPLSGYIEMALSITESNNELVDLVIGKACLLDDKTLLLHSLKQDKNITIHSLNNEDWQQHFSCQTKPVQQGNGSLDLALLQSQLSELPVKQFYAEKALEGYQFSQDFHSLKQLYKSENEALVYAECSLKSKHYKIHPVLLDAALQGALTLMPVNKKDQPFVPFTMQRFSMWRGGGQGIWSHIKVISRNEDSCRVDINIHDSQQQLVATIEGLIFKQLLPTPAPTGKDVSDILHHVIWKPKIVQKTTAELVALLERDFHEADAFKPIKGSAGRLNQLAVAYMVEGLLKLGCLPQQSYVNGDELIQSLAINSSFGRLMQRVLELLANANLAQRTSSGWQMGTFILPIPAGEQASQLLLDYPELSSEVELIKRCGSRLKEIWSGEIDPLGLVFPAESPEATRQFYRHSYSFSALNKLLAEAVGSISKVGSSAQPCRILEIGAGTGSATFHILPKLAGQSCQYTFTDVSSYFTQQAKQVFSDYDFVEYQSLDIERQPEDQGFDLHSYDIIIASNVLHATRNLNQTLQHCKQLLADNGQIILLEGVEPTAWIDSIFGLTEGWWRFNDDLRSNYPLLNQAQWLAALKNQGLDGQCIALKNEDAPFKQALIFASHQSAVNSQSHWLVMVDRLGVADNLINALKKKSAGVTQVFSGSAFKQLDSQSFQINPDSRADYQKLITVIEQDVEVTQVVDFWSLSSTNESLQSAEQVMDKTRGLCCTGLYLIQALLAAERKNISLCHVTRNAQSVNQQDLNSHPEAAVLWGINKVVALEYPELKHTVVDLDKDTASTNSLIQALLQGLAESQLAYREGQLYVPRLANVDASVSTGNNRQWQLEGDTASISALQLVQHSWGKPKAGQVEIQVQHAALNFIDVMDVLGLLPFKRNGLGMECVGIISRCGKDVNQFTVGQKVLALAEGSFADYVNVNALLVAPLPETISAQKAATLPVAFLTAAYALKEVANIQAGQRILIHAASGGTGMAAVQIALDAGAIVYATASKTKWSQVLKLGVTAVMNSRDLSFVDDINQQTGGAGVDIVFNSLSGKFINAGLSLLKSGGQFIEIGKRDILSQQQVTGLAPTVNYSLVDLRAVSQTQPKIIQTLFQSLLQLVEFGRLKPLPDTVFDWSQMQDAFRYMQQAKHTGKVILQNKVNAPQFMADANASYLITGGLKGVGLYTAQWLAQQGAKHLVLVGRTAIEPVNQKKVTALQDTGVNVSCVVADVNDMVTMRQIFSQIRHSGQPLKGIVHSVGVLNDSSLLQQNWQRYEAVLAPKISGAWQLHQLSLKDDLDFFLMYSSVAALLGSAGQSNHAAANAFLDAFAHYRRGQGLPAQSINWCGWSQIGSAAALKVSDKIRKGLSDITSEQGGQVLAAALSRNDTQIGVMPVDWPEFLQHAPMAEFFEAFKSHQETVLKTENAELLSLNKASLAQMNPAERTRQIKSLLSAELATVLGMPVDKLNQLAQRNAGFFELGLDSLTSVEFKTRINKSLGLSLSTAAVFDYPNINVLTEYSLSQLADEIELDSGTEEAISSIENGDLDGLTAEQAAALLAKELE